MKLIKFPAPVLFSFSLVVTPMALLPEKVSALDDSRLWLPTNYETLFLKLREAAMAAESVERCESVAEGTIDLEQSKKNHPIYRILCRQPNGRTYNEMVDGLSMETLTTPKVVVVPLTEEELAAQRLEEEAKRLAAEEDRKALNWALCQDALFNKTKFMQNLHWLSDERPETSIFEENLVSFVSDFDAEDAFGQALKYQARCWVENDEKVRLKIYKRPKKVSEML